MTGAGTRGALIAEDEGGGRVELAVGREDEGLVDAREDEGLADEREEEGFLGAREELGAGEPYG